jgi:hypothetical protein
LQQSAIKDGTSQTAELAKTLQAREHSIEAQLEQEKQLLLKDLKK